MSVTSATLSRQKILRAFARAQGETMKRHLAALLAALAFASPVLAEDCSKIAGKEARLACFDKAATQAPAAEKPAAARAAETGSRRCAGITKKGAQCKRNAKPGSSYCYQHGG